MSHGRVVLLREILEQPRLSRLSSEIRCYHAKGITAGEGAATRIERVNPRTERYIEAGHLRTVQTESSYNLLHRCLISERQCGWKPNDDVLHKWPGSSVTVATTSHENRDPRTTSPGDYNLGAAILRGVCRCILITYMIPNARQHTYLPSEYISNQS